MEAYLQYMKTLRSQMNDVEDQAAKISAEEQMLITTIRTVDNDLDSAKCETKQMKKNIDEMVKAKGHMCSQILEKQRKIASLESDSSMLIQTLELIQQERVCLSAKLLEKSAYYIKVAEDMNAKLKEQQDWVNSHKICKDAGALAVVKDEHDVQMGEIGGKASIVSQSIEDSQGDEAKNLMIKLESAKDKLEKIALMKPGLVMENSKMKESIEQLKCHMNDLKPELRVMDISILEEEHRALLSDKAGEIEYLQSLQEQIEKLKGISHTIGCSCGVKYRVQVGLCA
ncbi:uncharacterized protein LOC131161352 [Malania oleifera]|uniref:uncharacterized protein LOC131161352 n=1 Tax=Malania oleifera TaxID=397392 RepID=UPI0025ADC502|nr:uncharacterized protein LOC131161352 [Malania oleifera]